ncbi:MAG: hypothetical protein AAF597_03030 [Bacteroidota bacterium]
MRATPLFLALLVLVLSNSCGQSYTKSIEAVKLATRSELEPAYDTTVVLLPEFLLWRVDPEKYGADDFKTICRDSFHQASLVLDEIVECDCRLYAKSPTGQTQSQLLWFAQRYDLYFWDRVHYDAFGKPLTRDTLLSVQPYEPISRWGSTTSYSTRQVEITQYFKVT